jgi:hypothetical protein
LHAPQFRGLSLVFTHDPPQSVRAPQPATQAVPSHAGAGAAQATAHVLQCRESSFEVSQPGTFGSQSWYPVAQAQCPASSHSECWPQSRPQEPQDVLSFSEASQPSLGSALQSAAPVAQSHFPPKHTALAPQT